MIRVSTIMTKEVLTISKESKVEEAARIISSKHVNSLLVVDGHKPVGDIGSRHIVRASNSKNKKVKDIMTKDFKIVSPTTRFSEIIRLVKENKVGKFPVIQNGRLIGIITETGVVDAIRDMTNIHLFVQETILVVFGIATVFFLFYSSPLKAALFG